MLKPKVETPYSAGSLYLIKRGSIYHIQGVALNGRRVRTTTKCIDLPSATRFLDELNFNLRSGYRNTAMPEDADWMPIARVICARHKSHSKARGIPFNLTADYVYDVMREAHFRCAVSGISFSRQRLKDEPDRDPWGASIDRIENRHGYILGNIRVVTLAANLAMNQWGFDTLLRLSKAVVGNTAAPHPEKLAQISDNSRKQSKKTLINQGG